jgi:hypothetical protein
MEIVSNKVNKKREWIQENPEQNTKIQRVNNSPYAAYRRYRGHGSG